MTFEDAFFAFTFNDTHLTDGSAQRRGILYKRGFVFHPLCVFSTTARLGPVSRHRSGSGPGNAGFNTARRSPHVVKIDRLLTPSVSLARRLAGVSRQAMLNHLSCLRGCGLVVAVPEGRRTRYELSDQRLTHALGDLLDLVLVVDPSCCGDKAEAGLSTTATSHTTTAASA